jgi:hypothetical protein
MTMDFNYYELLVSHLFGILMQKILIIILYNIIILIDMLLLDLLESTSPYQVPRFDSFSKERLGTKDFTEPSTQLLLE